MQGQEKVNPLIFDRKNTFVNKRFNCSQRVGFQLFSEQIENILMDEFYWDESQAYEARFVLEELVENAFVHGCQDITERNVHVKIRYDLDDEKLSIRVESPGDGFDIAKLIHEVKQRSIDHEGLGGRGLYFIDNISDNLMFDKNGKIIDVELKNNLITPIEIDNNNLLVVRAPKRLDVNFQNIMLEKLYSYIGNGIYGFIFDFKDTDFVDSKGLGFLINIKNKSSFTALVNLKNKISQLLNRTGVSTTIQIFDNIDQCIGGLRLQIKQNPNSDNLIFISYSHKDKEWLDKLKNWIKPIEKTGIIEAWDDTKIKPGSLWKDEINKHLNSSKVAILLVSQNFLSSDFIVNHELEPLLKSAKNHGVSILWIAISDSTYDETEIANYQALNDPAKPLDSLVDFEQNRIFKDIFRKIKVVIEDKSLKPPA